MALARQELVCCPMIYKLERCLADSALDIIFLKSDKFCRWKESYLEFLIFHLMSRVKEDKGLTLKNTIFVPMIFSPLNVKKGSKVVELLLFKNNHLEIILVTIFIHPFDHYNKVY